jgi:hypothetical protein
MMICMYNFIFLSDSTPSYLQNETRDHKELIHDHK